MNSPGIDPLLAVLLTAIAGLLLSIAAKLDRIANLIEYTEDEPEEGEEWKHGS